MTLFLKKIGIILSASKPHFYSRLSDPILKIQSIYRENILGKQLSQARCFKYVFRLLHVPKFQIFSTKISWSKLPNCSQVFYEKAALILQGNTYAGVKKPSCKCVFLWVLPNVSKRFSCKHLWVIASAKYPFLLCRHQPPKNVSFNLGFFKYFWDKHCELLANNPLRKF